jgi:hypothetical protein
MVVRQSLPSDRSGSSKTALTNVRVFDSRGLRALGTVGIDGGLTGTDAGRARVVIVPTLTMMEATVENMRKPGTTSDPSYEPARASVAVLHGAGGTHPGRDGRQRHSRRARVVPVR